MPPNLRAALGTGLQTCTPSASVPFGEEPPVQASLPTQSKAGPLSVSSLFSPPGLTGRPRGATRLKAAPRRSTRRLRAWFGDTAFALVVGNLRERAYARGTNQCVQTICSHCHNVNQFRPHLFVRCARSVSPFSFFPFNFLTFKFSTFSAPTCSVSPFFVSSS